jgi:hypothetical protein
MSRKSFAYVATAESLFALLLCSAASATSLARMSIEQMAHASSLIVRARCISSVTRWEEGEIWTFTSFEVAESWKGTPRSRITVQLLGGRLGPITSHVSGVPKFREREEVILFLERLPEGDFSVVSWEQGTFRISRDERTGGEAVTQDTASFPVFDPATRQFEAIGVHDQSLLSFRSRVKAAIADEREHRQ